MSKTHHFHSTYNTIIIYLNFSFYSDNYFVATSSKSFLHVRIINSKAPFIFIYPNFKTTFIFFWSLGSDYKLLSFHQHYKKTAENTSQNFEMVESFSTEVGCANKLYIIYRLKFKRIFFGLITFLFCIWILIFKTLFKYTKLYVLLTFWYLYYFSFYKF